MSIAVNYGIKRMELRFCYTFVILIKWIFDQTVEHVFLEAKISLNLCIVEIFPDPNVKCE